jgi:hypothetical protein
MTLLLGDHASAVRNAEKERTVKSDISNQRIIACVRILYASKFITLRVTLRPLLLYASVGPALRPSPTQAAQTLAPSENSCST